MCLQKSVSVPSLIMECHSYTNYLVRILVFRVTIVVVRNCVYDEYNLDWLFINILIIFLVKSYHVTWFVCFLFYFQCLKGYFCILKLI